MENGIKPVIQNHIYSINLPFLEQLSIKIHEPIYQSKACAVQIKPMISVQIVSTYIAYILKQFYFTFYSYTVCSWLDNEILNNWNIRSK